MCKSVYGIHSSLWQPKLTERPSEKFRFLKILSCMCIVSWTFHDPSSLFLASFKLATFDFSGIRYGASFEKKKFFFPFLKICILDWLILFWNFDLEFFEKRILCSVHGCFWICYLYKPCHQLRSGAMHASNKSLLLSRRNPCPGVLRIEGRVPLIQHSQIGTHWEWNRHVWQSMENHMASLFIGGIFIAGEFPSRE